MPTGRGSITHKTIHITPGTLLDAIDEWIAGDNEATHTLASGSGAAPTNVLLVALHACGSLTPDILRAFLASHATDMAHGTRTWQILGVVVVGCCYNLMRPTGDYIIMSICNSAEILIFTFRFPTIARARRPFPLYTPPTLRFPPRFSGPLPLGHTPRRARCQESGVARHGRR